jgi:hypothetical protein
VGSAQFRSASQRSKAYLRSQHDRKLFKPFEKHPDSRRVPSVWNCLRSHNNRIATGICTRAKICARPGYH